MKKIGKLVAFICFSISIFATEPTAVPTVYSALKVEELAMRFRFPARYADPKKGELDPRGLALAEIVRRKLLKPGIPKSEVEFLLGPGEPEWLNTLGAGLPPHSYYSMKDWTLCIFFEDNVPINDNRKITGIFEDRKGEVRRLLPPDLRKTEQAGSPQPAAPSRK